MAKIVDFKGKIAQFAVDPVQSSRISSLMAEATIEELKIVSFECKQQIYDIAEDEIGSTFLKKLFEKLNELEPPNISDDALSVDPERSKSEIVSIFQAFAENLQGLKSAISRSAIGLDTFFNLLGESRYLKGEFVLILRNSMFMEIMMTETADLKPLFRRLFENLDLVQLEPLLVISSQNILRFSQIAIGLKNMNVLVTIANTELAITLVYKLKPFLLEIATHKEGNRFLQTVITRRDHSSDALVDGLAGNLLDMSKHLYANHVLQTCLQLGSNRNASFIIFELTPHIFLLLTHPYGNYVVQRILKRLRLMNQQQFRSLIYQIMTRRSEFEHNSFARQVLFTCQTD